MRKPLTEGQKTAVLLTGWLLLGIVLEVLQVDDTVREWCIYVSIFSILWVCPKNEEKKDGKRL